MAIGIGDSKLEYGSGTVAINGSGAGTLAVTFAETFLSTPSILVVPHEADTAATYSATSASKTGFTISVSGSALTSRDIRVIWFAHAKSGS